jgi:carbonic anhydrase
VAALALPAVESFDLAIPAQVRVSGHVYDVKTGAVSTVVDAKSRK